MPTPPRRALSNVGGQTHRGGQAEAAKVLASALASVTEVDPDVLTHGFHSYPARMHYMIARSILANWTKPGDSVLDPFCGSGTVLIEARRAGLRAAGVDLNPVACRVTTVKVDRRGPAAIERFEKTVEAVVAASLQRVEERIATRAPLSAEERDWYTPHVLRELAGLHEEIAAVESAPDQDALRVVLSAIAVKFSRQRADTSDVRVEPRTAKGAPTKFFGHKAAELAERWRALASEVSARAPRALIAEADVRELPKLVRQRAPYDLILTSPPYGGTYDYVDHHARRYPWLKVSARAFRSRELGARRHLTHGEGLATRWDEEVSQMLGVLADMAGGGRIVLLIGDGQVGGQRIDAVQQLQRLVGPMGLAVVAWATQPRTDFLGGPPRAEHLILLGRGSKPRSRPR